MGLRELYRLSDELHDYFRGVSSRYKRYHTFQDFSRSFRRFQCGLIGFIRLSDELHGISVEF